MLTDLNIRNFAIIDNLHVDFRPGLTVLTGETGAGKSIIVDAVSLILGGRASADLIRTGAEEATVEALFDLTAQPALLSSLNEFGVECDGELLVKRVVARSGKNRVFIGGSLSTLAVLGELARRLINIYGQHESQTLLKPENHLLLLDGFAALHPQRLSFSALYEEYRALLLARRRLDEGEQETLRRIDLLSFQSEEIGAAALKEGEDEELERERQLLVHGEKLLAVSQGTFDRLYGDDACVTGELNRLTAGVKEIALIDPSLVPVATTLADAALQLEDAALTLRDYAGRVEADPARLQAVDDRLDLIGRLKKKYAPTIDAILAHKDEADRELEGLLNRERTREGLDSGLLELEGRLTEAGKELTARRREA
ncbi:MAG TPA: AAA family ATPase, partial [Geobacteraceae bacterium]